MKKANKTIRTIPTPDECIRILQSVGCSDNIIRHSKTVRNLAVKIARLANADVQLVEVGALLHDIGRSKTHGIKHGVMGAKIARKIGLPENIVNIIEKHLGAGIPGEEAVKLGLPLREYIPKTLEEKIVAHADNLIENSSKQSIAEAVQKEINRGNKVLAERMMILHRELSKYCKTDLDNIGLD